MSSSSSPLTDTPLADRLGLVDPSLVGRGCPIGELEVEGSVRHDVLDPATGQRIATVPALGAAEARRAVDAAAAAGPDWAAATAKTRANILRRWFDLVVAHADDLARIMTAEQGKPLAEARGEILYGASFIEWFAEEARRVEGRLLPGHADDRRLLVMRQPVGVVAAITPWNFPVAMITRKVAPALAAGCTVVVKPAPETPLSALALATLARRAGLPAGTLNVVTGEAIPIGEALTGDPRVRKLTFTGSTPVGRHLMAQCAPTVKKLSLELGGNAPFIVFDDANVDAAVAGAIAAKFRNNGQTCVCANRLYVQDGVHDAFVERLVRAIEALSVGPGTDEGVDLGPLISDAALDKVVGHVEDALGRGARLVVGGEPHALGGRFYRPTLLTGATRQMCLATEETFGPVAPVFRFETETEVVELANDTEFGLASYFYARDLGRVWRVAEALEFGMVGVNTGLISTAEAPFGGVKQSGLGREGSSLGIDEYLETKYVCLGIEPAA